MEIIVYYAVIFLELIIGTMGINNRYAESGRRRYIVVAKGLGKVAKRADLTVRMLTLSTHRL